MKGNFALKNDTPLVSVIMSNYNTPEPYLRTAIESILNQTYTNFELIIIDDASTNFDLDIINSYKDPRIVVVQNEENHHIAYSANRGLEHTKGKYIARMDSDDICHLERFEKQVRFLEKHPDIDVLCTRAEIFGIRRGVYATNLHSTDAMKIAIFFNCPIVNPSVMLKASFIEEHSLRYSTDPLYRVAEDYEFWARCVLLGNLYEYPQVLLKYRTHAKQVSFYTSKTQIESSNHVRKNMLAVLGIAPSEHEVDIHYKFCTEEAIEQMPLKEIEDWACRLLDGNKKYHAFHERLYKHAVLQHFFIIAIKSLLKKQITFGQFIKSRLTIKALAPIYYIDYLKRFIFSKRLNRISQR